MLVGALRKATCTRGPNSAQKDFGAFLAPSPTGMPSPTGIVTEGADLCGPDCDQEAVHPNRHLDGVSEEEMQYPSRLPQDARARVEAEKLRAYAALEQEVRGIESFRRGAPFIRCVMRVFIAFAREACEFGKKSNRWEWSDSELDQRCREFLLSIVIDAWEEKAKDLGISKMFSSPHHWGYSLNDEARRQIEKSPEWKQYQELLLDAHEAQSARAVDCGQPRFEQSAGKAFETYDMVNALSPGSGTPAQQRESSHSGIPRSSPQPEQWEDIEILFISDERVQITVGAYSETRNYNEMG
jgi:hypothetical protein